MVEIDTTRAPDVLRVVCTGPPLTFTGLNSQRRRLVEAGMLTRATRILFDARALQELPTWGVIWPTLKALGASGVLPAAVAFLVATPLQYGVASEAMGAMPPGVHTRAFFHELDAWDWLEDVSPDR